MAGSGVRSRRQPGDEPRPAGPHPLRPGLSGTLCGTRSDFEETATICLPLGAAGERAAGDRFGRDEMAPEAVLANGRGVGRDCRGVHGNKAAPRKRLSHGGGIISGTDEISYARARTDLRTSTG